MAENNDNQETNVEDNSPESPSKATQDTSSKDSVVNIDEIVQKKVDEQLKDIKQKLDKAYNLRDEAHKKVAEFEQKEREAEIKRLKEEGKLAEAYEKQLADERAKAEVLERKNIELTRDLEVRNALANQPFRNDNALEMAYREIVGQLVRNEQGEWVHKTGVSIRDFVKVFADNGENEFLFKPKVSTGAGLSGSKSTPGSNDKKSIFEMSQEDVLKMAAEGKLRR